MKVLVSAEKEQPVMFELFQIHNYETTMLETESCQLVSLVKVKELDLEPEELYFVYKNSITNYYKPTTFDKGNFEVSKPDAFLESARFEFSLAYLFDELVEKASSLSTEKRFTISGRELIELNK